MNKQDVIYRTLRKRIGEGSLLHGEALDMIVDYMIEKTKLDTIVEALRYISNSRYWDGFRDKHLLENLYHVQDMAEDALSELYREE